MLISKSEKLVLAPNFIKFPNIFPEAAEAIKSFHEFIECNIPRVCGAIDGTHIEIQSIL